MVRRFESADRLKWMEISPVKHAVLCVRALHPTCMCCEAGAIRHSRSSQRTVYFTMIKDVLHIMFTIVRKRKDSSF